MLITATNLTSGGSSATSATYDTASITPLANNLILLSCATDKGSATAPTFTASGCSLTWVEIVNELDSTNARRISVFRALGSPSTGVVTITKSASTANCEWSVDQLTPVDLTGTNGSNAIVQNAVATVAAANSLTATLSAFGNTNNATFGAIFMNSQPNITQGTGFSILGSTIAGSGKLNTQWRNTNDTTVDWTWDGGGLVAVGIALEIKQANPSGFITFM